MERLEKALGLFDHYNNQGPETITRDGKVYSAEYFYALQLYQWVLKLEPSASEALLLASRCQHIGRWEIPRTAYPAGKAGYLSWRSNLAKFHAAKASELMKQAGYDTDMIGHVQRIILKQKIKTDPEVQTMENALCLVFLEFQLEDFMKKHDELKMITILKKSWSKMSEQGREAALTLSYSKATQNLLQKALQPA